MKLLKVEPNYEKFTVWLETPDGTRIHLTTKCMNQLMQDLDRTWYEFIGHGFDGVVDR